MTHTVTLTIRDHVGTCLESRVGTFEELDEFLKRDGYPLSIVDILETQRIDCVHTVTDDDGLVYYLAG